MKGDQFFISYSNFDASFVTQLRIDLKKAGINSVFNKSEINVGEDFHMLIEEKINEANIVIVIISAASVKSYEALEEIEYAISQGKKVIPLVINKIDELPLRLRRLQSIDFTKNYHTAFDHLLKSLRFDQVAESAFERSQSPNPVQQKSFSLKKWLSGLFDKSNSQVSKSDKKIFTEETKSKTVESENLSKEKIEESLKSLVEKRDDLDLVKCSVFAPSFAQADQTIMIQVFAHNNSDDDKVKNLAVQFDENANLRGVKQLEEEVRRNSKLDFCLSMNGVEIDEPVQSLIWRGEAEAVQFVVHIPGAHNLGSVIGTVYVTQNSVPFGHLKFLLKIVQPENNLLSSTEPTAESWKRYKYAFISYASADRAEVLKRVQMLSRFHINFFQDLLTLEPGDRWEKKLYEEINKSDVFFLFWSTAAKNSNWVMQEVRYALKRQTDALCGSPEIMPIIIEGPPAVPPPPELKDLHFNDTFIYFING